MSLVGKSVWQGAQTSIHAALAGGGGAYYADCAARPARAPGAGPLRRVESPAFSIRPFRFDH